MSNSHERNDPKEACIEDRLSSRDLAAMIIDALLRADIVKKDNVDIAMKIAIEEIDARKAMGDY